MKKYYFLMQTDKSMLDDPLVAIVAEHKVILKNAFAEYRTNPETPALLNSEILKEER